MELFFNLTLNGLATGMLIFLLAAGLTLIFGLMDVLNFAHGGLFAWGAYSGTWIYASTGSFFIGIIGAIGQECCLDGSSRNGLSNQFMEITCNKFLLL